MKTNRIAAPYYVDQKGDPTTLDTRVCWDGETEQLSPGGVCDANGMQPVYMLTSLATAQGTRNLLRAEVVGSSIRPPAAVTLEVGSSNSPTPISATFIPATTSPSTSNDTLIPAISIDGGVHTVAGASPTNCSPVAAVASNTPQGTASLQIGLNILRAALVDHANNFCNADGSSISASNRCTPLLAWVRGTGAHPKFTTTPLPTSQPRRIATRSHAAPTPVPSRVITAAPAAGTMATTITSRRRRQLRLQLRPQRLRQSLQATAAQRHRVATQTLISRCPGLVCQRFLRVIPGTQATPRSINPRVQPLWWMRIRQSSTILMPVGKSGSNYYELPSTSLDPTQAYGSLTQPAVLIITDSSLKLSTNLTGFGILQVPNDFEMNSNSNLQWTGIVMVRSSSSSPSGSSSLTQELPDRLMER